MIGLFGKLSANTGAPVSLAAMARRVRSGYAVDAPDGTGAALGRVAHLASPGGGRATDAEQRFTCVSTGAIYDFTPFKDLAANDVTSPAGLVLALANRRELDRIKSANGQFAAALYDRDAHRLTLITDRLGTFALHVWQRDGEVVFATHTYVLLGDERIAPRADPAVVLQLLAMQRTIGQVSPINGVRALPAATIAEFGRQPPRERKYWRLEWRKPDFSVTEGAGLLAGALRNAVARQSRGRQNGLLLSGGIDSRLILGVAERGSLDCWTTSSYETNPELALARQVANLFGARHTSAVVAPQDMLPLVDETAIESDGLYPVSTQFSVFMPRVREACDTVLTGHGLDYTLRGYYLPARFFAAAGSRTRLPMLRPIPTRPTGADVLSNLRQGPPLETVRRIIRQDCFGALWQGLERSMHEVLEPWLDSPEPLNAWDAFILHCVSKHYAFTGMMSVRAACDLAMPSFDNEVFDIYLRMPPRWRVNARLVQKAMRLISPEMANLPNANTHFRADLPLALEAPMLIGRAGLRRLGLAARDRLPTAMHSAGSWQNIGALYREDPGHRQRFTEIRGRLDVLCLGVIDPDGLARCIDEHLDGRAKHEKLLRQLLTHDAWVRRFGVTA